MRTLVRIGKLVLLLAIAAAFAGCATTGGYGGTTYVSVHHGHGYGMGWGGGWRGGYRPGRPVGPPARPPSRPPSRPPRPTPYRR